MLTPFDHLHAPALRLRRLRRSDAPAIFARYARDPEVTRWISWPPHRSLADTTDFLTRVERAAEKGRGHAYAILPAGEGELCGAIGFDLRGSTITLGYVLARSHWGRGLASAALRALTGWALAQPDLWRVEALCHPANQASARVMEKCGFQREGLLRREAIFPNLSDEPQDSLLLARVK
jgi:ribosomal-protein-alanine N-acetyltransferase